MVDETSQFTFISHDENSKERKHRLYSHSRQAAVRNKRRLGREALRPARPLPVKDLTLRPPTTTANSSASTTPTTPSVSGPSPSTDYSDPNGLSFASRGDSTAAGNYSTTAFCWEHPHAVTPTITQPVDHVFYTGTELCETYPDYLPALDPDSYAMMLYDTSLGAFEESTSILPSPPELQRFIADNDIPKTWLHTEHVHQSDGIPEPVAHNIDPETISPIASGQGGEGPQTSRQNLFFGLDLDSGELGDDDAIMAAFERQSVSIDQYNEAFMHTTFSDQNTVARTTSHQRNSG